MRGTGSSPGDSPPVTGRRILKLAAWFGLVTGIGAVALDAIKKFVLGQVTLVTPQVVWMSPVTYVLLGLFMGSFLALLARIIPRWVTLRVIVFVLAAGGSACGLLTWGKALHDLSVIVLSLGIAVQAAAFAQRRSAVFFGLMGRTAPWLVGVVIASTLAINVGGRIREARAVAALPPAAPGAPNVLWIILDTMRWRSTSLSGYRRPTTPNLERFARSGITFEHAITATSWTLPSHAAMFTGRSPDELSADWEKPLDARFPTLAEYLRAHGYRTGGIAGNFYYCNSEWGLARGFVHYQDYELSLGHALASTSPGLAIALAVKHSSLDTRFWTHVLNGRRVAPDVIRDLMGWLRQDRRHPFFAFVNFYDAHDPYAPPNDDLRRIAAMPAPKGVPVKRWQGDSTVDASSAQRATTLDARNRYDAAILYLDEQVGHLLDALEQEGFLRNTLVVIAGDHGEEFGAHGFHWHGHSLYLPSIRVPLIVRLPDESHAGQQVNTPVPTGNLAATTVDLLGLSDGSPFPGPSFAGTWSGRDATAAPVYSYLHVDERDGSARAREYRSIVDGTTHYIVSDRGEEELFDFGTDPLEQTDLAAARRDQLTPFRALVARFSARVATDSVRVANRRN